MAEQVLAFGLRVLIGVVGAAALGAGLVVGVTELRYAYLGSPPLPSLLASAFAVIVVLGGVVLLRGALRGRLGVRSPRPDRR